jgi:transitional endoplasmic reticulum ATPase
MPTHDDAVIEALRAAVAQSPDALPLRRHLADLLFANQRYAEAEAEYRTVLAATPADTSVKWALAQCFYHQQKWMVALVVLEELLKQAQPAEIHLLASRTYLQLGQKSNALNAYQQAIRLDMGMGDAELEAQLMATPPLSESTTSALNTDDAADDDDELVSIAVENWPQTADTDVEKSKVTFADVGGMDKLKEDIRLKIIHPLNHPDLYKAYGKTIGGGILMYGPPGCGKTHLARATAGEVQAYFVSIGIHDVLNMYLGQSEQNLHVLFEVARRHKPCVIFIDEVDALGASRSDMRQSIGRHVINQLLAEMDGVNASNDGVLILAATNAPWHMDAALRRPGRFDRVIFVPPPDAEARAAILQVLLREKPINNIDYAQIAKKCEGFSGADLKGVIDLAIEGKLQEAIKKGVPAPLETKDLLRAARDVKPTTTDWFASARNHALYANQSGLYDDVLAHLKLGRLDESDFSGPRWPFGKKPS